MSYFIELLYNNNTKNFIDYKLDKDKITEKYKKDNNISSIWAINFMPEGNDLILNQYLTEKSVKLDIKKPKYKDWSFKNEFLKSYQYRIERDLLDYSFYHPFYDYNHSTKKIIRKYLLMVEMGNFFCYT